MPVTPLHKPLTPAQTRIEAIVKVASEQGMGGFALAKLRTTATAQIEPLVDALRPFAAFADKAEAFVEDRVQNGGSPILPSNDFRLSDFKRAQALLSGTR